MVSASEANSASDANPTTNLNIDRDNTSYTVENLADQNDTVPWILPTLTMSFTSLLAVLGISYVKNEGNLHPETLFGEPMSFDLFLTVLMISFYFAVNGAIFSKKSPNISKASTLIALTSLILSFTVLLWTLLPSNLRWQPWVFLTFTIAALVYHCSTGEQNTS